MNDSHKRCRHEASRQESTPVSFSPHQSLQSRPKASSRMPQPLDPATRPNSSLTPLGKSSASTEITKWEVDYIPLIVSDQNNCFTGTETEICQEINLAAFINNKAARSNKKWKSDPSKRVYLPRDFNVNTPVYRRTVLSPVIARACAQAGFGITMKGWEKGLQAIRFVCNRNRKGGGGASISANGVKKRKTPAVPSNAKPSRSPTPEQPGSDNEDDNDDKGSADGKKRNRYVPPRIRPTATEEVCPFSFYIYWEAAPTAATSSEQDKRTADDVSEKGRWFIVNNGAGCCVHMGHARKPTSEIRIKKGNVQSSGLEHNGGTHPIMALLPTLSSSPPIPGEPLLKRQPRGQGVKEKGGQLKVWLPSTTTSTTRASPATTITSTSLSAVVDTSATISSVKVDHPDDTMSTNSTCPSESSEDDEDTVANAPSEGNTQNTSLLMARQRQSQSNTPENISPVTDKTSAARKHIQSLAVASPQETKLKDSSKQQSATLEDNKIPIIRLEQRSELQLGQVPSGVFELLMPLYQEMACLVATNPEKAHYAVAQLQEIVEHLRKSENRTEPKPGH
jgi:hypothetical protein